MITIQLGLQMYLLTSDNLTYIYSFNSKHLQAKNFEINQALTLLDYRRDRTRDASLELMYSSFLIFEGAMTPNLIELKLD